MQKQSERKENPKWTRNAILISHGATLQHRRSPRPRRDHAVSDQAWLDAPTSSVEFFTLLGGVWRISVLTSQEMTKSSLQTGVPENKRHKPSEERRRNQCRRRHHSRHLAGGLVLHWQPLQMYMIVTGWIWSVAWINSLHHVQVHVLQDRIIATRSRTRYLSSDLPNGY